MGEQDNRSDFWTLAASAIAHALVIAVLIFGLPVIPSRPQEEQSISVTIEPPPEPAKEARAQPAPPPPAPKAALAQQKAAAAPVPILDPVRKFGEKDAGPRLSPDGSAAEETPTAPPQATPTEAPQASEPAASDGPEVPDTKADDKPSPPDLAPTANTGIAVAPEPPASAPTRSVKAAAEAKLPKVEKLFSRAANGSAAATRAMAGIPRGVRAGRLCATELRLQLQNGIPPYFPDLLPSYELKDGVVLTVRHAAFRALGTWYSLGFECTVQRQATSVVSFAFRVGEPLSREETQRRGLPSQ